MNYLLFTVTAVTLLVIASFAVELLADTYDKEVEKQMKDLKDLDELIHKAMN